MEVNERMIPGFVLGLILLCLGAWGVYAWWWSVTEFLRGALPLGLIFFGILSLSSGLSRIPLQDGSTSFLPQKRPLHLTEYFLKEDWWAVWLGIGLVVVDLMSFTGTDSLFKGLAVSPGHMDWHDPREIIDHLTDNAHLYFQLFVIWSFLFGVSCRIMGIGFGRFLPSFAFLFALSIFVFSVSGWVHASEFNLEPPVVALILGVLLGNVVRIPERLLAACRVEYFVKVGVVLLGATFPVELVLTAGPVAIMQAGLISILACSSIYLIATRGFGLDRRLAAVMSAGGAVCGVSASIAVAAAVGAKKEHLYTSVALVVMWALTMILVLPFISHALDLPAGVAGAWIGTAEFAGAAGFAAASTYGEISGDPEAAIKSFTLMKVIGRDMWIGIWSLFWAFIAVTVWDAPGGDAKVDKTEIWKRFPKFVVGFFAASILTSLVLSGYGPQEMEETVKPALLDPISTIRNWVFIFCFLSIGLTTRFSELKTVGGAAFLSFAAGVAITVFIGYVMSVHVFGSYWANL